MWKLTLIFIAILLLSLTSHAFTTESADYNISLLLFPSIEPIKNNDYNLTASILYGEVMESADYNITIGIIWDETIIIRDLTKQGASTTGGGGGPGSIVYEYNTTPYNASASTNITEEQPLLAKNQTNIFADISEKSIKLMYAQPLLAAAGMLSLVVIGTGTIRLTKAISKWQNYKQKRKEKIKKRMKELGLS